ncbi:RarD protein [Geomicrobium sp. JCM 19037]|uniref:EamA family transporter RarD n=1 Tax=unclassified Geomicrobium TaxID=2628951 RepID=UPI00045F42DE|nr:EamA family transporter RarD [Geomicrobium sp. JCM 19037]GAK03815.1 RarD protein [Geomicrobium sp. JCM 19037]
MHNNKEAALGAGSALVAYVLWGLLPLYWKMTEAAAPMETLAHRVVWALLFMVILLLAIGKGTTTLKEIASVFRKKKTAMAISAAAILISINWFVFIFAVNTDRVIEASLGYYINPLMNVLLATIFLNEKLAKKEIIAVLFAVVGVLIMTVYYGYFPWAAFVLALSFCGYGLIKKLVPIGALSGLTIETLLVTPFALGFLAWLSFQGTSSFSVTTDPMLSIVLIGGGLATALPLLLFAVGAKRITFSLIGILQYVAPTFMLIIGVFIFQEPFSTIQLISFAMIWVGLLLFSYSRFRIRFSPGVQH